MGLGFVTLSVIVLSGSAPVLAQVETPDEIDAVLSDEQERERLDAATLYDLDELLRDPVRLEDGDLHRLLWVPWVTPSQVKSLRAALPVATLAAWSALPDWTEESVQRLLPFVVFAPQETKRTRRLDSSIGAQADLYELRSGRRSIWRLHGGPLQAAARVDPDALDAVAGFVRWDSPGVQWMIGDMRRTTGLGMMWSSRVLPSSALGSVAMTASWSGTTSFWRDRVVRGVAARVHGRGARFDVVHGTVQEGEVLGADVAVSLPHGWHAQFAGMQLRRQLWLSACLQRGDRQQRVALELVKQPHGLSAAMFWRRVQAPWRVEAAVAAAPGGVRSPLSMAPSSARDLGWFQLRLRTSWSRKILLLRGGWAQTQWNASTQRRRESLSLQTVLRTRRVRFDAQFRKDEDEERSVQLEALGETTRLQEARLLLRVILPVPNGMVSVERRSHSHQDAPVSVARGIGWRLGGRQRLGRSEFEVSAAFLESVPGAGIVFSEPSVGPSSALFYGASSSMRFAMRWRHHWRHVRASLRGAIGWDPERQWQSLLEAGIRVRLPGANAF